MYFVLFTKLVCAPLLTMEGTFLYLKNTIQPRRLKEKIHLRAAISFLEVNKLTPIFGIISEFNLLLPQYRPQLKMVRQYYRLLKCSENIVFKKVFFWDKKLNVENRVRSIFTENQMQEVFESGNILFLKKQLKNLILACLKNNKCF